MRTLLMTLGGTYFWIVSPESLAILTNGAAMAPLRYILAITFFAMLVMVGARFIHTGASGRSTGASLTHPVVPILSTVIGGGGIIGTTIFAATGLLVTAGFTFNEVFLYYFPNFGFAFLLLFGVAALHLIFPERVNGIQGVLVSLVILCLLGLTISGLFSSATGPVETSVYPKRPLSAVLPFLLIFVGFEQQRTSDSSPITTLNTKLFVVLVTLLIGWMVVSGLLVAPRKLAFSTIPYMTASGGIAGQVGRLIMGFAIICGSFAAVSGLFKVSRNFLKTLIHDDLHHSADKGLVTLLTLAVGGAMAGGLAGDVRLEIYIRGALTMWLFYGGLCVFLAGQHRSSASPVPIWIARLTGTTLMFLSLASVALIGEGAILSIFFACLLAGSLLCIMFVRLMHGYSTSQRRIINNKETLI